VAAADRGDRLRNAPPGGEVRRSISTQSTKRRLADGTAGRTELWTTLHTTIATPPPQRSVSPAHHLCDAAHVPNRRRARSIQFKGYTLNAFQVEAARAIEAGDNVLLAAPTGSGKTLVAEYAIDFAMQAGRRAIYTSPIKALSNQKFRDFKADGLRVGLMTGDLTLDPTPRSSS
jgi:superfamily II RNA helicase